MYPHERSLVKTYEGRPFAIVGVNSDDTPERVARAIEANGLTWDSFFDGGGTDGPISTRWGVRGWPATWLIDSRGVIRHRDLRGEALDEAIAALVREAGE